ncbi:hypothetical protein ACEQ8H_000730 [Pleosporales sp. CAS-2024a]
MPLKDLLKKKDKIKDEGALSADVPEFHFFRTTTSTQESIQPPSHPDDPTRAAPSLRIPTRAGFGIFRRPSSGGSQPGTEGAAKGLERLHFGRSRSSSSANVPENLPEVGGDGVARTEEEEASWEKRATVLVTEGALAGGPSAPTSPRVAVTNARARGVAKSRSRSASINAPEDEVTIQKAIQLHEQGNLEASTALFGKLADPNKHNNALAQVLYGLALRHAWGIEANQEQAVHYLSMAAANSAEVEKLALGAGMKKGGSAKGELVLAMYELANCFRNGWGIKKDPAAAKQYYETAANLGDTDAMNEVAWCYIEGFGTKKDKFQAAQFLRLAESKGNKTLGNTW